MGRRRWDRDVEECGRLAVHVERDELRIIKGIIAALLSKKVPECELSYTPRRWEEVIAEPRIIGG